MERITSKWYLLYNTTATKWVLTVFRELERRRVVGLDDLGDVPVGQVEVEREDLALHVHIQLVIAFLVDNHPANLVYHPAYRGLLQLVLQSFQAAFPVYNPPDIQQHS